MEFEEQAHHARIRGVRGRTFLPNAGCSSKIACTVLQSAVLTLNVAKSFEQCRQR